VVHDSQLFLEFDLLLVDFLDQLVVRESLLLPDIDLALSELLGLGQILLDDVVVFGLVRDLLVEALDVAAAVLVFGVGLLSQLGAELEFAVHLLHEVFGLRLPVRGLLLELRLLLLQRGDLVLKLEFVVEFGFQLVLQRVRGGEEVLVEFGQLLVEVVHAALDDVLVFDCGALGLLDLLPQLRALVAHLLRVLLQLELVGGDHFAIFTVLLGFTL